MKATVLIVDDEPGIRDSLSAIFEDEDFIALTACSAEEALQIIESNSVDLVLLDVWLPQMDGLEALAKIKELKPNLPVIMISGHGSIETAVTATRQGAYDFLEKPLSMQKVLLTAKRALQMHRLEEENKALKAKKSSYMIIGNSPKFLALLQQVESAAKSSSRVLILGESGSGKELVARLLHEKSPRCTAPFVEVNCAAIPQELIESELFGHEKGSFTGAVEKKIGKFELADKGTLFLDEIADMSLQTQAKALRAIETQVFQRVGGNKNIKVDVRLIAATNKDLTEEVKKGNFREDLYFRLNVIPIHVPALRHRKEDIPLLVEGFVKYFVTEQGLKHRTFSPDAIKLMMQYDWPGNIRELKNFVERLMIMAPPGVIDKSTVQDFASFNSPTPKDEYDFFSYNTIKDAKEAFEKAFILRKLKEFGGNISKTAEVIDMERSHLHKKIKAYGINSEANQ